MPLKWRSKTSWLPLQDAPAANLWSRTRVSRIMRTAGFPSTRRREGPSPSPRVVSARPVHRDEHSVFQSFGRLVLQHARHGQSVDQAARACGVQDAAVMSPIRRERSAAAIEPACVDRGQPLAAAWAGDAHLQLVARQLEAAARQNRRAPGIACSPLRAPSGRGSPKPTPTRVDAPANLGGADAGALTGRTTDQGLLQNDGATQSRCPRTVEKVGASGVNSTSMARSSGVCGESNERLHPSAAHGCKISPSVDVETELSAWRK